MSEANRPTIDLNPSKTEKFWSGDIGQCDVCKRPIKGDFFDAKTYSGPWATMCLTCAHQHSPMKMGTGSGQHYKERSDGKWIKVAG